MPNDRSDAALRERLEIAGKAAQEVGTTLWKDYQTAPRELCILDAFNERILTMEDYTEVATARHIAASSPDVVQADIEEILRLRQEVARLDKEADWFVRILSHYTEDCPLKFKLVYEERFPIPKIDNCHGQEGDIEDCAYFSTECWREASRNAVEEKNG